MHLPFTTLDVFTSTRHLGNPLALIRVPVALRPSLTQAQKQAIAREFNLSETVFLHEVPHPDTTAEYDIFTVNAQIAFAGHPTIGTALYVARNAGKYPGVKRLRTLAGVVDFEVEEREGKIVSASAKIPHDVRVHAKRLPHPYPEFCPRGYAGNGDAPTVPLVSIVKGMAFHLVPLSTVEALGKMTRASGMVAAEDAYKAKNLDEGSGWDVGLTGTFFFVDLGTEEDGASLLRTRNIRTRMLEPGCEDPGTGSASSALCCWWALQEVKGKGKGPFAFHLVQGVEVGRRCDIYVKVTRSEDGTGIEQVELGGGAVEVMEGVITIE